MSTLHKQAMKYQDLITRAAGVGYALRPQQVDAIHKRRIMSCQAIAAMITRLEREQQTPAPPPDRGQPKA